jgi:isoamylase
MNLPTTLSTGVANPLGAHVIEGGVNFAVYSEHAQRIEVCIFDASGARQLRCYPLFGPDDGVFHGRLDGAGAGLVYGLRAHGVYDPDRGHRFNAHKLLLDPYAREVVGQFAWRSEHHGYELGHPDGDRSFDSRDNAIHALKARVAAPLPPLSGARPKTAARDRVIYEAHVKGLTRTHPDIPEALRGTYAGLAHPAAIAHLQSLGITTLCLLPVQYAIDEPHLHELGLSNYWGYNTLAFFAPTHRYATSRQDPTGVVHEFRGMVQALHAAGLEVILDVVYNHTPEGNESGPTLSFRGLDNVTYYRTQPHEASRYENHTGCGNTVNVAHPYVTRLVLDSLRYWVEVMGVDGFRFDLAPVLGRTRDSYDMGAAFFTALRQDPVLADAVMVAEPWDIGPNGYQLGHFPGRFLEWNDRFRDSIRRYWLTRSVGRGEFARRFTASSDVFQRAARRPTASVNYVTVHDGFCLEDVVRYSHKHNWANGEDNRDGRDGEPALNFGFEGPTADPAILAVRARVKRALLGSLLLAQGTPMLCAGDEIGKTQQGNNNPYCQDNATSWLDWSVADKSLQSFVGRLLWLRRREPLLRMDAWYLGHDPAWVRAQGTQRQTLRWLTPHGHDMHVDDWHHAGTHTFACQMTRCDSASAMPLRSVLFLFNPELCAAPFCLPSANATSPDRWWVAIDTADEISPLTEFQAQHTVTVTSHSMLVLFSDPSVLEAHSTFLP